MPRDALRGDVETWMPTAVLSVGVTLEDAGGKREASAFLRRHTGVGTAKGDVDNLDQRRLGDLPSRASTGSVAPEVSDIITLRDQARNGDGILAAASLTYMNIGQYVDGTTRRGCVIQICCASTTLDEFGDWAPKLLLMAAFIHLAGSSDEPTHVLIGSPLASPQVEQATLSLAGRPLTSNAYPLPQSFASRTGLDGLWSLTPASEQISASMLLNLNAMPPHAPVESTTINGKPLQLHVEWPTYFQAIADLPDLAAGRLSQALYTWPEIRTTAIGCTMARRVNNGD